MQVRTENRPKHVLHDSLSKLPEAWSAPDTGQMVLRKPHSSGDPRELTELSLGS